MLEKTSGVLTRAGIDSLAGLEERLYEELAGVTIADLLNRAVGQFFANAQNAISMVSIRSGSTEQQARAEKHRIIFSGKGPVEQVHPLHLTYKTDRPKKPAFLDISRNGRALMFSKNLLGSFVGDLFTVNGIYAGADNELGHPMASVLGQSYYNGLTTPLLSVLLMEWASSERDNRSFSKFANDAGLINERGAYRTLRSRLAYSTRRLVNTGFIEYKSKKPEERSFYFASGKDFNPDDFAGKYGVTAIFGKLKKRISADEIVKQTSYSLRYVHRVVEWLVDNGYVIVEGWPAAESSALYGTWKSRRLLAHLERSMGLVGFQPQANGVGSVWDAPRIDVPGLVDYRRELVDPLTAGYARKRFEEACRTAYRKHAAEFKKRN